MVANLGILALQGNFEQHHNILKTLNIHSTYVKYSEDLDSCNGLIIPGGESTSMSIQMDRNSLRDPLINFSFKKPILGTCAGMIMLSDNKINNKLNALGIMNFTVDRNAWGTQIHSFKSKLTLNFDSNNEFEGVFIRAPKIKHIGKDIIVLAKYKNEPVMITDKKHYACSFHPELVADNRIHSYFIKNINE